MIQVYTVNVSQMDSQVYERLYRSASAERQTRADGCRHRENALCCITAEALLRYAVKKTLSLTEFELETNTYGKPRIKGREDFQFNLSHSGSWVVLACGSTEVGIDVEQIRMDDRKEQVAHRFFAKEEQSFVFQDEENRAKRFFQIWTAKESYLKYLGTGLQKALDSFDVCGMTQPYFYTHWLQNCCMTLCTTETEYELIPMEPEQLFLCATMDG